MVLSPTQLVVDSTSPEKRVMKERVASILSNYFTESERDTLRFQSLGSGRINDTFLVQKTISAVVLQRINGQVFQKPQIVAENFSHISHHLNHATSDHHVWQWAKSVDTLDGKPWCRDDVGDVWRCQSYISSAQLSAEPLSPLQVAHLGKTLGTFHLLLSSIDHRLLQNPLPGFHHLPSYESAYKKYDSVMDERKEDVLYCHHMARSLREAAFVFPIALQKGMLSTHVIHGDPKLDNFVFNSSGNAVGLIDLDTVYLNTLHIDLGDCLRSLCNVTGESSRLSRFDLQMCDVFLQEYFQVWGKLFPVLERQYIYDAILSITYELGLRFFTDHLAGDVYFKVESRGENVLRAVSQFLLAEDIVRKEQSIRQISIVS